MTNSQYVFLTEKMENAFIKGFNVLHRINLDTFIGYRPPYRCADINITSYLHHHQHYLTNNSDIDIQYGKCDINILVNESTGVQKYKEKCINGYKFGIPADRSTVTDVSILLQILVCHILGIHEVCIHLQPLVR